MTKGIGKFDKYASRFYIKYIQRSFHTLMGEVAIYIQFYFLLSGIFGYLISKFWAPFSPHDSCVYVFALQTLSILCCLRVNGLNRESKAITIQIFLPKFKLRSLSHGIGAQQL